MLELSDTLERKFIESYDIDDYEILTDDGWKDCKAIHKTVEYDVWQLDTKEGDSEHHLKCADNHIVFDSDMQQVFVKDLVVEQKICTEDGFETVTNVRNVGCADNMYDIELSDDSNHRYFTNGILSHNTTCYTILACWMATFFPEKKIMICANKLQTAIEVMDRIRLAYEYMPKWLKVGITVYNKSEITFSNRSSIRAFATSSSASRGFSCNVCVIDEMGFIPKNVINEFFTSVMPVISSSKNSKAIIVSTPNGTDNLYFDIWQAANSKDKSKNKEGWKPFRIDWFDVPGRDQEWKEKQIATIGIDRWRQEFGNEFISSSFKKLIPDDIIERYRIKLSEYKNKQINQGKQMNILSKDEKKVYGYRMYHAFNENRTYLATADVAEGTGGDASTLYIWDVTDITDIKQCAIFSSTTTSTVEFAYVTNEICRLYGCPFFACESNGIGMSVIDQLRITYGYENIVRLGNKSGYGIRSHVQVKSKACLWFNEFMTTNGIHVNIYNKDLIDEFGTFVKKDTDVHIVYNALRGYHDDHIMSAIWMAWMLSEDVIDQYFQVIEHQISDLGKTLPKKLQPLVEYDKSTIDSCKENSTYREFIEWKAALAGKYGEAVKNEMIEDKNDPFFNFQLQNKLDMHDEQKQTAKHGGFFIIDGGNGWTDWSGSSW